VKPGYFALRVEGDSMCPDFPPGTVLLVAGGEYPQRGDTVVAKIRSNGQVVVKLYHRKDNQISLESIHSSGKNFEWSCKDNPGFLDWMYPVVEANIDLRAKRWQANRPKGDAEGSGED
jgi:phage repressor protein C with HTH and peptisase S24 domain